MISVDEAISIVLGQARGYGTETVALDRACGRVLAEPLLADRDLPPYDRATMDGVAIRYADFTGGLRQFRVVGVQAAGDEPLRDVPLGSCVQIMTGAAVPDMLDTVVPIEDLTLVEDRVVFTTDVDVALGQYIHRRGVDVQEGGVLVAAGRIITPADVPIAATVGRAQLKVSKVPRVVVATTGDELVGLETSPAPYQIRRSNNYGVQATLAGYGVHTDTIHLTDDRQVLQTGLGDCLKKYDVVIISGGVSKGEFDYIPQVLDDLAVTMRVHGVKQKPGKPFWFGTNADGAVVFALPGNPVSTYLCLHAYILPWLRASLGDSPSLDMYGVLGRDVEFAPELDYFLQASLVTDESGRLIAMPLDNNGSGDFVNLSRADGFIRLPAGRAVFRRGDLCKIIPLVKGLVV